MVLADAAFDWSTYIDLVKDKVIEAMQANAGAIFAVFGLLVAVNFVFVLINRAVGSGRPRTDQNRD